MHIHFSNSNQYVRMKRKYADPFGKLRISISRLHVPDWNATQYVQMVLYRGKAITPQVRGFMEELSAILNDVLLKRLNPLTNQVGGG
mgnify:CR=1 FL=1